MIKKHILSILLAVMASMSYAIPFEDVKFNQPIDFDKVELAGQLLESTNDIIILHKKIENGSSFDFNKVNGLNGITFDVSDDGYINIVTTNSTKNELDMFVIDGKTLRSSIKEMVLSKIASSLNKMANSTNTVNSMVYNPLWGKKIVVIGDSFTVTPSLETSYPYYIAQRNNMTLVNKGSSDEKLCNDILNSYTNDIPSDADFILCQIGENDVSKWDSSVSDTDMTTNTFKGCFNNLLIGLKKNYPNAKVGVILDNNWVENIGQKTEDTTSTGSVRDITQWQKIQCQKLNIPVFDPVEDTRMFTYYSKTYAVASNVSVDDAGLDWYDTIKREIGTDYSFYSSSSSAWVLQSQYVKDGSHASSIGNMVLSFYYERWLKTMVMFNY